MINVSGASGGGGGGREEKKDYSSWFWDQEDLSAELVAVNLVGLYCVLLLIFCCQNKNMYKL